MLVVPSVIIEEIHVKGVTVFETEYDPPIPADCNAPKAFQVAAQPMQPQPLDIHIVNSDGGLQAKEQARYLVDEIGPQLASIIVLIQSPEPTMPNASDHDAFVY
jgi:hypothetical protein